MADGTSPESGQTGWTAPQANPPTSGYQPPPTHPNQPGAPQQPPPVPHAPQSQQGQQPQQPYQSAPQPQGQSYPPAAPQGQQPPQGQPYQSAPQPPQGQPYQPSAPQPQQSGQSPWWASGAAADPWRNPQTSAMVAHSPQPALPPTEMPPRGPKQPFRAGLGSVVVIAAITALVASFMSAALVWSLGGNGSNGTLSGPGGDRPLGDYQQMIDKTLPSVVTIWIEASEGSGNGSGWVMDKEGHIVTNKHVADLAESGGAEVSVQFSDGQVAKADVLGTAKSTDIAVMKVDKEKVRPLPMADSEKLAVGDPVLAMGAPLGLSNTVTDGIVSAVDRPVQAGESEADSTVMAGIQTDASINPGNSGGPLVSANGELIGVNTSIYSFSNERGEAGSIGLGFAIPGNQATRVAKEIVDEGEATKPVLGTELEETKSGDSGAEIDKVDSAAPAADAGLKDGDVITKLDDTYITDDVQLQALVLKQEPGDSVKITYERDGSSSTANVKLDEEKDD